ncbi:MAG: hypothetical protein JXB15_05625 [Anaerolineales bacterium]|nr:hypothetical protein [Anaerolineales bacterium]
MAVYKVSYVIIDSKEPGSIINQERLPQVGDHVLLRHKKLEVLEVLELIPPRGDFHYIHVTCRLLPKKPALKK